MKIIIVGDGKVGATLVEHLSLEGHDIIVIDKNQKVIEQMVNSYDVMGVCGNGASYEVQLEAGVSDAQLFVAATSSDEQTGVRAARNSKVGFVKMVFNFLVTQELFVENRDRYYPTDRFRALIENYFDD